MQVKASWPELAGSASSRFCTALKERVEGPVDHPLGLAKNVRFAKLIPMSFLIIFWRGKESYSFLHCSVQRTGKNDGGEAVESPVSKSYSLRWRFPGVFFLSQKNLLYGCFKIIFFPQLTFVHTSSELAVPIPSSHWKTERFSCYFSCVFFLSFVKSLAENHSPVVFPLSELWRVSNESRYCTPGQGLKYLAEETVPSSTCLT